ncbi:MAG: SUMF1/EgtB/PvdO family nonheme iron enzyme [Candidatus Brocadiia bacterium]
MLRKLACLVICLSVLLPGCEKREPERAPSVVEVETPAEKPPPAETSIPGMQGLFIGTEPVTIGEYVEYLRATAQPVPETWQEMKPDSPGAERAVTGLSRNEAELYATWAMKRLPTAEEWAAAEQTVGARPYPWSDGEPSEPQAVLHLVRDYQRGSPAEEQARQAKSELPVKLMEQYQQRIAETGAQLEAAIQSMDAQRSELWQQVKPEFFSMMDKRKEVALRRARQRWQADALELLRGVVLAKGKAAARLTTEDLTAAEQEQIIADYNEMLTETLTRVQNIRQELEGATGDLQDEVVELTRKLEQAGPVGAGEAEQHAAQLLADAEEAVQTPREAHELITELRNAAERLTAMEPSLEGVPSLEQIQQRMAELDEKLQTLPEAEPMPAETEELRGRLQTIGETMEREFVKEDALLEELPALVDLRARKEAIQAQLNALQEALGKATAQQAEQQEPAGTEE